MALSGSTVFRIMKKELNYRPWKPHYVQELKVNDPARRLQYAEDMREWMAREPALLDNILWSDEAIFFVGGFVNKHNCHYWADSNPHKIIHKIQNKQKLTVWCGISSSRLVGPFIIRETMNGDRYLHMLQTQVWPEVSTWENAENIILMQDGAPPHFKTEVRNWLDNTFPDRWIGRAGPHLWPARSPDLTPCDYFLWGYLKEQVYRTEPTDTDTLEISIRQAIQNIPADFIRKACHSVTQRINKLIKNKGKHIEI